MGGYIIGLFAFGGLLTFGLMAAIFFNIKARKNKGEPSNRLKYSTIAYLCIAGAFAYYVYWLMNGDWFRGALSPVLAGHMIVMFIMIFVASKHAHKSENMPGIIRMCLGTFCFIHFCLPSFTGKNAFVFFKFVTHESIITISFTIALFLAAVNLVLLIAMFVSFMKVRKD